MNILPASDLGNEDYIKESAYLVARGVRPMSLVGYVVDSQLEMLKASSRLEIMSTGCSVVPFVIPRCDGFADCGFASESWVVDLYEWLVKSEDVPKIHRHQICGLLLGYSAKAIRTHDSRCCGRRFIWSPEQEPRTRFDCTPGTEGSSSPC
jgi:hypothetical protein